MLCYEKFIIFFGFKDRTFKLNNLQYKFYFQESLTDALTDIVGELNEVRLRLEEGKAGIPIILIIFHKYYSLGSTLPSSLAMTFQCRDTPGRGGGC